MQGGKEGGREGGRENEYIQRLYNEIPITECLITHTDTDTPHTHRHRHTTHTHMRQHGVRASAWKKIAAALRAGTNGNR
jgi:hypothetical protein